MSDAPASLNELCYTVAPDGSIHLQAWLDHTGLHGLAQALPLLHARLDQRSGPDQDETMLILGRREPDPA